MRSIFKKAAKLQHGIDFIYQASLHDSDRAYFKNVLITQEGYVTAMPFDTGVDGLWHFDGQIFYQRGVTR